MPVTMYQNCALFCGGRGYDSVHIGESGDRRTAEQSSPLGDCVIGGDTLAKQSSINVQSALPLSCIWAQLL